MPRGSRILPCTLCVITLPAKPPAIEAVLCGLKPSLIASCPEHVHGGIALDLPLNVHGKWRLESGLYFLASQLIAYLHRPHQGRQYGICLWHHSTLLRELFQGEECFPFQWPSGAKLCLLEKWYLYYTLYLHYSACSRIEPCHMR